MISSKCDFILTEEEAEEEDDDNFSTTTNRRSKIPWKVIHSSAQ